MHEEGLTDKKKILKIPGACTQNYVDGFVGLCVADSRTYSYINCVTNEFRLFPN